jgi:protoheme IX farnesyltransferase
VKDAPVDITTALGAGRTRRPAASSRPATAGTALDYLALTKPRLNLLVVFTSAVGYHLAVPAADSYQPMALTALGTALVAGGAAVLNQLYERDTDALMLRTRLRPLPAGRVTPGDARTFGAALAVAGISLLALGANLLAAFLALATLVSYIGIYTPMKRRSPASTLVGAVPGALPALIGWAAAHNAATIGGWALFAIVFLWQIPHFMAIAWMYRDDYARAGFPMLPVIEPDGRRAGRQAVLFTAALLPASLLPVAAGIAGAVYVGVAVVLGLALLAAAVRFAAARSDDSARLLFYGSITYLPLLFAAMILS